MHRARKQFSISNFHLRKFKCFKHAVKISPTFSARAFSKQGIHSQMLSIIQKTCQLKKKKNCCRKTELPLAVKYHFIVKS